MTAPYWHATYVTWIALGFIFLLGLRAKTKSDSAAANWGLDAVFSLYILTLIAFFPAFDEWTTKELLGSSLLVIIFALKAHDEHEHCRRNYLKFGTWRRTC